MWTKKLVKRLKINGKLVDCTTSMGLARIVGKSKDSILNYEKKGYLPMTFLKVGTYRYYPISLCQKLKVILDKFPTNRPPDQELIVEVNKLFKEERSKLCQK